MRACRDFPYLFNNILKNINEGNYGGAMEELVRIRAKTQEELVESTDREEMISLVDDLMAYLKTKL